MVPESRGSMLEPESAEDCRERAARGRESLRTRAAGLPQDFGREQSGLTEECTHIGGQSLWSAATWRSFSNRLATFDLPRTTNTVTGPSIPSTVIFQLPVCRRV